MFDRHANTDIQTQSQCWLNPSPSPTLPTIEPFDGPNQPEATMLPGSCPKESLTTPCLRQLDSKPYLFFYLAALCCM